VLPINDEDQKGRNTHTGNIAQQNLENYKFRINPKMSGEFRRKI
jgi:hypothetical protein